MHSPSRRNLLTAAAGAMAVPATALAAQRREEGGDGAALVFGSRAVAQAARIPASADALFCSGYARAGDRGEALYKRVGDAPAHAGKFRSVDGTWWELAENRLNPFQFGAAGTGAVDDSPAIQAMFDYVVAMGRPLPIQFLGARYLVKTGLKLPTVPQFIALDVDGGGAVLMTDAPITIFSRLPKDQLNASYICGQSHFDIHHLEFRGTSMDGQIGLHIGAAYSNLVRNCLFSKLQYGSIGTFCLGSAWRDNLYNACTARALVLQSGTGYDQGPVWAGASEPNSPCNVNVVENCRVFGHSKQKSAFGIFGSDAVRVLGCISEGHGAAIDLHFDYQSSPNVKLFHVDMFHCEAPKAKVHFKIRSAGIIHIDRLVRSYPIPIYDAQGSVNCQVRMRGLPWLADMPKPSADGPNPQGRWFYHSEGNGHAAASEGKARSGSAAFFFDECMDGSWELRDPEKWEGGVLPDMLHVRGAMGGNRGMMEWSNVPIHFAAPIAFADDTTLSGMKTGSFTATTAMVPAQSSVSETVAVPGLAYAKHFVTVNPSNGGHAPPAGIAWNGYVQDDGVLVLRLTNVTAKPIALKPQASWVYCAPSL